MASLGGRTFNPNDHDTEQRDEYPNLPDGIYRLEVSEADLKEDQAAGKAGIKITQLTPDNRKVFQDRSRESWGAILAPQEVKLFVDASAKAR